jgi:ribonucleotide reductase beta subunit family protein with ferritin-like domain
MIKKMNFGRRRQTVLSNVSSRVLTREEFLWKFKNCPSDLQARKLSAGRLILEGVLTYAEFLPALIMPKEQRMINFSYEFFVSDSVTSRSFVKAYC